MSRPSVILPSVKLFYSYRREEKEDCLKRLQELVDKLKDSFQFQHQIDESIAPPGTYFRDEILQAMRKSDIIFLLLTREYMMSEECQWELRDAIELSRRRRVVVIPVLGRDDFDTWQNHENLGRMTWLPKERRFSIKTLHQRVESEYFLVPLQKALRDLTQRLDIYGPSRPSITNEQRDADARLEKIRSLLRRSRLRKLQPAEISLLIDALDDENLAIRKEVTKGLGIVFQTLDQRELERTLESPRTGKGLIRFLGTPLQPEERLRVKIAVRKIQERKLQDRECLFSEGLVEILCCEPKEKDVELLEKVFVRATPEFQKDILRALPASPELPVLVERLLRDIRCMDVRRFAITRTGEAPE